MDKTITEALKKILPEEHVSEVSEAVESLMAQHYSELESEFQSKLDGAYNQLSEEKQADEQLAEQGYQQAYEIIGSLMQRLDEQREEFETALEEGFEEAFNELQKEKGKNGNIEVELYDEFDGKLKEMKDFMVNKVDEFLNLQETEIYEHAKRDIMNDPSIAEQKVAVNKMAEILSDYMDRDDLNAVASSKIEEAHGHIDALKAQMRIVEARNTKLSANNNRLVEQVNDANELITEASKVGRKERAGKRRQASGRGHRAADDQQILSEYVNPAVISDKQDDETLVEGSDPLNDLLILSGLQESY